MWLRVSTFTHTHVHSHAPRRNTHMHAHTYNPTHAGKLTHTRGHTYVNTMHACTPTPKDEHTNTYSGTHTRILFSRASRIIHVSACSCESRRGEGRKKKSIQTCQDFVARTQDSKPTNHIAETGKLHVKSGKYLS